MKNKIFKIFILTLFIVLLSAVVSAQTFNYMEWSGTSNLTKEINAGDSASLYFLSSGVFTFDYPIHVYLKIYNNDYSNYLTHNGIYLYNAEFDFAIDGTINLNYLNLDPGFYNIRLISFDSFGYAGPEEYLYLRVNPTTPSNNPPVFTGIIPDQTINNGEVFVDINLNDYFSDPDNDDLVFSTNANLFDVTINNGIASINYNFDFGSETISFTACDTSNACINSNPVNFSVLYVPSDNILNLNNIDDVFLDINDNVNVDLYSLTTYTDSVGNVLDMTTLDYDIINSTCVNTNVDINSGTLSVSSINVEETCGFMVYVEETVFAGSMQSITSDLVNVVVNDSTPANNPPVFNGVIIDQSIFVGDVFVDVDLNDYFSDVDGDVLVFSSDAVLFDVDFVSGVVSVGYVGVGSELVTFTGCDPFGACVSSNPVNFSVLVVPNNPPVFSGVIVDQSVFDGEVFVDVDLNDFFSDIDNDVLVFSSDAVLFDVDFVSGVVSVGYSSVGSELITFTGCDPFGACVSSNPVNFSVLVVPVFDNILTLNNIDDVFLDINDNVDVDLYSLTTYTDSVGNVLDMTTLDYDIINSTCVNTNVVISSGLLSVSSNVNEENCSFRVYVEETVFVGNMQFVTSNVVDVVVEDSTPANNPPVFNGVIADQSVFVGEVFVDVDLNDYFSDIDNDVLVFSSDAVLFDVDFVSGVVSVGYSSVGSELVMFTGCDPFGACVDSNPVNFTVLPLNNFTLDEFDCEYDPVPLGMLQVCSVRFSDQNNNPVEDADVSFYYSSDDFVGDCITNNQGYCNVIFNVSDDVGSYDIFVSAEKYGFNDFNSSDYVSFDVVEAQYEIREFNIYDNISFFNHSREEVVDFYRGEDVYVEFKVFDVYNQVYVDDPSLFTSVILYGNSQVEGVYFDFYDLNNDFYQFVLDSIPLSDDFLGEDLVVSYAFNGSYVGQDYKTINVLNNVPVWGSIDDVILDVGGSITLDLNSKVFDVEDIDLDISVDSVPDFISYDFYDGILTLVGLDSGLGQVQLTVEDSDGGVVSTSFDVYVDNQAPVFTGVIVDQIIFDGDVFVDINLNDYFSDPDNDQLTYGSNANLFNISVISGVVSVGYVGVGSELVTFTGCDPFGACVDSNPVNFSVLPIPYSNFTLEELDCQYDILPKNELQICHAIFYDQNNAPVENAEVTFYYTSPAALEIATCMTNADGYCNINFNAPNTVGNYDVFVSAYKQYFNTFIDPNTFTSFEVVDAQYEITEFYIYDNENFFNGNPQHDQIVFYRGEDVYVEFKVYDIYNQVYVTDPNLFTDVTLYGSSQIQQVHFDFYDFNNDYYQFSLDYIPLDDGFLGEDLIISYALNGNATGQEHRTINVLNNVPVWQTLQDIELTQDELVSLDLNNKVTDLEDINLIINIESAPDFIDYELTNGILSFSGISVGQGNIVLSAEDSDNGIAFTSFHIKINPSSGNHTLIAYFDAPSVEKPNSNVEFDASNSIGQITRYCWDFGGELGVCTQNPIIYHSFDRGTYEVKLVVNDIYGNSDSYSKVIKIKRGTSCSDGVDNDGDGFIDMDDPGCQESDGFSETNLNTDLEQGLKFEYVDVYSDEYYIYPGDEINVNVMVTNKAYQDIDYLRVIIMSPDLGIKLKSELFDLDEGDSENFRMNFEIPYWTYPGEYPVKVIVKNDDIIHSTYRFIYIN